MPSLGAGELVMMAIGLIMLLSARKLPNAAQTLGQLTRVFKTGTGPAGEDAPPTGGKADPQERPVAKPHPPAGGAGPS